MDKCLGYGGLGDCFIIILKLLEYKKPFIYTHIDISENRLKLSMELLNFFGIQHDCKVVPNIREWWYDHNREFDKCFNMFAKGYIDIPRRPYHWQPCVDEGYHNLFDQQITTKTDRVAAQVSSGGNRTYKEKLVVEYVMDHYDESQVFWFGADTGFEIDYGTNYCGKLHFINALFQIALCRYFVGFPSVLLYWSLWHKSECYLFTDHQGKEDLRIHDEWKKYLTYDI